MVIPDGYYRTSIKGLIFDSSKRFLLCQEDNGFWDFPGGGMEFGEQPEETLKREIKEEMGLEVLSVGKYPMYFVARKNTKGVWITNVFYEVKVKDINITPSEECIKVDYFDKDLISKVNIFPTVSDFVNQYDPKRHL